MAKDPKQPVGAEAENGDPNLDVNKTFDPSTLTGEALEKYQEQLWLIQKRKAKGKNRPEPQGAFSITSLMDIFTIILVYLLMNYSTDPTQVTLTEDMTPPKSIETFKSSEKSTVVAITQKHILVEGQAIVQVKDGKVSGSAKRDGEEGFYITPLFDALKEQSDKLKKLASMNSAVQFKGKMLFLCDGQVQFRLLTEVMYTAGQAEFGEFEFIVINAAG
jgi:hypothetical protein